ncbi:MAG: hypothetical protein COT14_00830 [Candidatus Diapherotrites archaeon CG08_land_8_20_14_0_20_30_16]|nr:MAG: hypothetical protein COT14_00830 [Candidatus Diapherotrites archaeon CG08_land_8_20_14_0_20_30_16]
MSFYSNFYSGNYKKYLIVPAIVLIVCLVLIFTVGVKKGIDLSGGTQITFHTNQTIDSEEMKNYLQTEFKLEEISVTLSKGIETNRIDIQYLQEPDQLALKQKILAIKNLGSQATAIENTKTLLTQYNYNLNTINAKEYKEWMSSLDLLYNNEKNKKVAAVIDNLAAKFNLDSKGVEIKEISPTLSESFYNKALWVAIIAIIGIIIVVFLAFREFVPSVAIIACGILDVLGGLTGMVVLGIPLSLTTIPALLMLLGYSIDTDVLLTTKLLKRSEGSPKDRVGDSMRTGIYMTTTTLGALIVMLIFSYFYNVSVIFNISLVLFFGLIVDLIATWMMNGPILLWYVESKKKV